MDGARTTRTATLYVTEGSGNSFKPALALHQLGQRHDLRFVDVLKHETHSPAFLAVNKAGQVPYYVGADGFGVAQSNAILWLIAEGSPLMPETPTGRAQALQWMFYEQTRLEPNISPARFYTTILPHRTAEFAIEIPRWRAAAQDGLKLLDEHLASARFIVKRHGYSVGDIAMFGYVHLAGQAGIDLGRFPSVSRWIRRIEAAPRFVPIDTLLDPRLAAAETRLAG